MTVGVTSFRPLKGFSKFKGSEHAHRTGMRNGKVVITTIYHYRIPADRLKEALAKGAKREPEGSR